MKTFVGAFTGTIAGILAAFAALTLWTKIYYAKKNEQYKKELDEARKKYSPSMYNVHGIWEAYDETRPD